MKSHRHSWEYVSDLLAFALSMTSITALLYIVNAITGGK